MSGPTADTIAALVEQISAAPMQGRRRLVALGGPPASGKSTLADLLAKALTAAGMSAQVVPMDGFHLDNTILTARGLLARKGSPDSFDANGFLDLVGHLATRPDIYFPTFDRARDIAIAGSGHVGPAVDTVIVEGNYLLLDAPVWRDLAPFWDISIQLDVPMAELERRLIARWLDHGLDDAGATARAHANDLPNARMVAQNSLPADVVLEG